MFTRLLPFLFLLIFPFSHLLAQGESLKPPPSPSEFLGYEIGTRFTFHHRIVDYVEAVARQSPKVALIPYGTSIEGRPLLMVAISSEENLSQRENIRRNNLIRAGFESGTPEGPQLPVIWMSYNIHGDEAACSEAAMETLYHLVTGQEDTTKWLDNSLILFDPCVNPDGRDRYVNWFTHVAANPSTPLPYSMEHNQPWPGGRTNHYLIDLNRDWCWQTQHETRKRLKLFNEWRPQVLVDFHEMGVESPYFFAPAAKPYHEEITEWQRDFQVVVGANNAKYFDKNHWLYYTNETFDLFYPGYGDTWSMFNGAIGFTYEQGGSRDAGVEVARRTGDTLTLRRRIDHHVTTGLATIEASVKERTQLLNAFASYFEDARNRPTGKYRTYVIKHRNETEKVKALLHLLEVQQITYEIVDKDVPLKKFRGFDYQKNGLGEFSLEPLDVVISAYQSQSRLLKVLFEPDAYLEDSLTYDLTAWALPYVYGLEAYATAERSPKVATHKPEPYVPNRITGKPYAYLSEWNDVQDARFLSALLDAGLRVRYARKSFSITGKTFPPGSLIIPRADNPTDFDQKIKEIADIHQQVLTPMATGMVSSGHDLGSGYSYPISAPKVALLGGKEVSANSFGEMWYFFENDLHYPVTLLHTDYLERVNLSSFNVLILPSGDFQAYKEKVLTFVSKGGKAIIMENAIPAFSKKVEKKINTQLAIEVSRHTQKTQKDSLQPPLTLQRYLDRERTALSNRIAGSIYRVSLDNSHPLAFGYPNDLFLLKRNGNTYPFLSEKGWNVGRFGVDSHVSGFAGNKLKQQIPGTLAIGVETYGRGKIVYMTDSPVIRGFWHGGKLLMSNAVFLGF